MVDFTLYEEQFVKENESLICVMAILREEFSGFYLRLVYNPHLIFEDYSNDENKKLVLFLDRTKATWFQYEESVDKLDKVISNSTVFKGLPNEITEAIEIASVDKIDTFVGGDGKRKSLVNARLIDNLTKAINRGLFVSEVPMLMNTIAKLHDKNFFDNTDYLSIVNLLYNSDLNWEKINWYVLTYSPMPYVSLSKRLFQISYSVMMEKLADYYETKVETGKDLNDKESDVFSYFCSLAPQKLVDGRCISCFEKAYFVNPSNTFKYTYQNAALLYSDNIISQLVGRISNKNGEGTALWQLEKINVQLDTDKEDIFVKVIDKILELCPEFDYQNNNKDEIVGWINQVNDYLEKVPKLRIKTENLIRNLVEHFSKTIQETSYYNKVIRHNIYISNKDDEELYGSLLRLMILSTRHYLRIDVSPTTVENLIKSRVALQTIEAFNDFVENGISVYSYAKELMSYMRFDEQYLKLLKSLLVPNQSGELQINSALAVKELSNIVDDIISNKSEILCSWLSQVITFSTVQGIIVDLLSKKNTEDLLKFPSAVLKFVTNKFEEEIQEYENNFNILGLIATNGTRKGIRELVKIIIKNLLTKGKEVSALALVLKLHSCNNTDKTKLLAQLEDLSADGVSKEDVDNATNHLNEICK